MASSKKLIRLILAGTLAAALLLTGCTTTSEPTDQGSTPAEQPAAQPAPVRIGTLATQDTLPLWVAEEKGYFGENGLDDVQIEIFQSAQELQAAFTAGAVDALMTDVMVAANLHASGTEVVLPTVMLGATTEEGRFAVVGAPGTNFTSMKDLKEVKVGIGTITVTEYVFDKLMAEADVDSDIVKEDVKKMPVRFQLLMSGKLKAASLPEPFVTLAEQGGAKIVPGGDDTKAQNNLSQTVLAVNREFAETPEGGATVDAMLAAWDQAVEDINADPNSFRQTLVDKAKLPAPLANTYEVSTYPKAQAPAAEQVQDVLDWMKERGYLTAEVTPEDLLGK